MAGSVAAVASRVLALGYEGPETVGSLLAAAGLLVAAVAVVWLIARGLVAFFSDDRPGRPPRSRRPR